MSFIRKALIVTLVISIICLIWVETLPVPDRPTRYALLIGAEAGDVKYRSVIDDPPGLAKILQKYSGIKSENIKILTPKTKQRPTYDTIVTSLNDLVAKTNENDEVILLFLGHGMRRGNEDYFMPLGSVGESGARLWKDLIPHSLISGLTRKMRAKTVVTIYENCREEMGKPQKTPELPLKSPFIVVAPQATTSKRLRVTLYSCMPYQLSYRNESGSHGLFTEALRLGLSGAAIEKDRVTLGSAMKYARISVFGQVRAYVGAAQIPFASIEEGDLKTAKQLVLSGPFTVPPVWDLKYTPLQKWQAAMSDGYEHMLNGNRPASLTAFRKASRLEPTYMQGWLEQAFILGALKQNQRAQDVMLEFANHVPQKDKLEYGKVVHQWFFLAAAESLYRQVLKSKPNEPEALCWMGLLKYQQNKIAEAEQLQKRVIALTPNWYSPYLYLGQIYNQRKELAKAQVAYRKAYSLDAKNWTTGFEIAYFLQNSLHRYVEAEKIYRECIRLEPKEISLRINLAECLFKRGKLVAAKQQVIEAKMLGLQPHPAIKHLLALVDKPAS